MQQQAVRSGQNSGKPMMRFVGLILIFVGLYVLGENIIFVSPARMFNLSNPTAIAVLVFAVGGVIALIMFRRQTGPWGWVAIGVAIAIALASGQILIRPLSLWMLVLGLVPAIAGFQLMLKGRL